MKKSSISLLGIFSFLLCITAWSQDVVPLFTNPKVEVKYASLSPDGKYLAVAISTDSLLIKDAVTLQTIKVFQVFTSGSQMSDAYTGRQIFYIDAGDNIVYVRKKMEGEKLSLYLVSQNISSEKINYEVKVHSIDKSEFDAERLYNRLTYHLSATAKMIMFSLNENIIAVDIQSGTVVHRWQVPFSFFATLSDDNKLLAYASADSVTVLDMSSRRYTFKKKIKANGLVFKGDSLISFGDEILVWNHRTGDKLKKLYHQKGFVYGMSQSPDKTQCTFSVSYFSDKGFVAAYQSDDLTFSSVYHLPKTAGYVSFFHPVTGGQWVLTTRGLLYQFHEDNRPRPVSQSSHRREIVSYDLSNDRRTLISAAAGGEIFLWDIGTGRIIERYQTNQTGIDAVFFDHSDRDILFFSYDEYKKIHRTIPSNPEWGSAYNVFIDSTDQSFSFKERERKMAETKKAESIASEYNIDVTKPFGSSGVFLVGFSGDNFRVVDLKSRQTRDVNVRDRGIFDARTLEFYRDNIVILEGEANTILFIDLNSGNIVRRLGKVRSEDRKGIHKIIFNKSGDTLITVANHQLVQLWNLKNAEKIAEFNPSKNALQENVVDFKNGRLSFISENNNFYIASVLDIKTNRLKMVAYLDTTFYQKTNEVEIAGFKGRGYPIRLELSPDAKELCVLRLYQPYNQKGEVFVDWWDLSTLTVTHTVAMRQLSSPCWNISWEHQRIAVWDFLAMSKKEQLNVSKMHQQMGTSFTPGYDGIMIIDVLTKRVEEVSLDKIGIARLAEGGVKIASQTEAWIKDEFTHDLHLVDFRKKIISKTVDVSKQYFNDRVGSQSLISKDHLVYSVHPWNDGDEHQLRSWSLTKNQVDAAMNTGGAPITTVGNHEGKQFLAIGTNNNVVSVHDLGNLKERFHIVQDDDGHYAFLTSDNYYKADKVSASALQFSLNGKSYSLYQFDAWFNRPDKVLAATGFARAEDLAVLERAAMKRVKNKSLPGTGISTTNSLPDIVIKNAARIPLVTQLDSVKIEIESTSTAGKISALHYKVNGVPVSGSKGVKVTSVNKVSHQQYVHLLPGVNKISVTSETESGITSLPDQIEITSTAEKKKQTLHLFAVAINDYKDPSLKLNYAVKDARDVLNFFKTDTRFANVTVDSLFNDAVTYSAIQSLAKKLKRIPENDMVIVFFAGHGVLDENFDFRFGTWALDAMNPNTTAILYDDIHRLLDGISPRNKLLLIDACHSGEVDKDELIETTDRLIREKNGAQRTVVTKSFNQVHHNVFGSGLMDRQSYELMQDLFLARGSDTGAQVVVATAGDSYAIESADWKNGFFTYALLHGLKDRSADLNKDNEVTVDELVSYLKTEVKNMSEGKQMPRFREENPENYFSVWRY
jgi:WD40 repeat protein